MAKNHRPFSFWGFSLLVVAQQSLLLVGFRFLAPGFWDRQTSPGPGPFLITFTAVHLFICFFEWGFHRYVLHCVTARWLKYFADNHRHHHELTPIQLRRMDAGPGRIVLNRYPITEIVQNEDAAFPPYALLAFWILFTPLLVIVQWALPTAPIMLAGYSAITWSMASYELFHAVEHLPYDWWKQATEHRYFGKLWRKVYGFHHFHHANIKANEAISGFFGLPVADWVFHTYHQPPGLLLEGRVATAQDFKVRDPWPFVAWLDEWARQQETKIRHAASA